jgi:hypothetical protein
MAKEKVHSRLLVGFVLLDPVLCFVLFLWPLDRLYFILYFFFGHWIDCTLFCTFSFAIGLFVSFLWPVHCLSFILYFFFGHWIARTLSCTFSFAIGLSVLYFVLFLWSLPCLSFILYFFFSHWFVGTLFCSKEKVQNKVQTIQ